MFVSRIIPLVTVFLLQPLSAHADSLASDLERCAVAALAERQQSANKISVNTSGLSREDLDHNRSSSKSIYRMNIRVPGSDKGLGIVTCGISKDGELINASFET